MMFGSMAASRRLLWVGAVEDEASVPEIAGVEVRHIALVFDDRQGEFDVADRRIGSIRHFSVHPRWRSFGADFQQQLLNRHFTDELLSQRPTLVVIDALTGASMDLVRVAALLGFAVLVRVPAGMMPEEGTREHLWLSDSFALAAGIYASGDGNAEAAFRRAFPAHAGRIAASAVEAILAATSGRMSNGDEATSFGYASYAFGLRDHGLLYRMQLPLVEHFDGCTQVLELACGPGVFLDILRARGISARGVEREPAAVRYARGLGFDIDEADALDYLTVATGQFDGIYCSHFVEHLSISGVDRLIGLVAAALRPGGVALFVFPDPESIRSQLLGFWRDPEHVRFYHPDLIELMCRGHGLDTEFNSQRVDGRQVVPFALEPPLSDGAQAAIESTQNVDVDDTSPGWVERLLARFGIVHSAAMHRSEQKMQRQLAAECEHSARLRARLDEMETAVRKLWAVNQTWAWDDNAVIRVRKSFERSGGRGSIE